MDIIKGVTFITDEDRWMEKLAIGVGVILVSSVLSIILIGILGFFIVAGYTVRLLQNVRDGKDQVLPEWNEWSADLKRGFKLFIVGLVWTLGIWIFMIPMVIGGAMSGSDSGFIQFMGATLTMTASCFMMFYGIFILLASPGFSIAFAEDEHIRSGLALSKVWTWTRANLGQVIIVAIAVMVASFIISTAGMLVGTLLCIVGLVITIPLATLVTYIFQFHLYGQLARAHPFDGSRPVTEDAEEGIDGGDASGDVAGLLESEVVDSDADEIEAAEVIDSETPAITEAEADAVPEELEQIEEPETPDDVVDAPDETNADKPDV